ncbi:substrate-binding domain-containing protein [Rhodococcus zopfii]|uniref:substrate-binding domain-containing protein n=1 Tax=Rhodococcus zopfii TaxID=43772 RepID=UPI0014865FBD|nr:substrate-binding domain-containing protein [Rhodococcus zopfii]
MRSTPSTPRLSRSSRTCPPRSQAFALATLGLTISMLTACASTTPPPAPTAADATDLELTTPTSAADIADAYDIRLLCGDRPLKVAYHKGAGNTNGYTVFAELTAEAAKCPNIDLHYLDAQGSQQKAISDINGLVAQDFDAIVAQPEFGAVQLPSFRSAVKDDVPVVTMISDPGGQVGVDLTDKVVQDFPNIGMQWSDWLNEVVGKGTVVFLGGTPGAPSSKSFFDAFKAGLDRYPDLQLVQNSIVNTNWDAAEKKRIMAGLLAQHGRIDAVVSDYGLTDLGVLDAYKDAGLEPPALATVASANGNGCRWEQEKFPYLSIDAAPTVSRVALRKAVAAATGIDDPEPSTIRLVKFIDTEDGKNPPCDPSYPLDADLSANLTPDEMAAIFR